MTSNKSLLDIKYWIRELNCHCPPDIPKIIFGNKSDLKDSYNFETKTLDSMLQENNLKCFFVSALTGEGINEAF
jgi:Ras-related protein Rab-11A